MSWSLLRTRGWQGSDDLYYLYCCSVLKVLHFLKFTNFQTGLTQSQLRRPWIWDKLSTKGGAFPELDEQLLPFWTVRWELLSLEYTLGVLWLFTCSDPEPVVDDTFFKIRISYCSTQNWVNYLVVTLGIWTIVSRICTWTRKRWTRFCWGDSSHRMRTAFTIRTCWVWTSAL